MTDTNICSCIHAFNDRDTNISRCIHVFNDKETNISSCIHMFNDRDTIILSCIHMYTPRNMHAFDALGMFFISLEKITVENVNKIHKKFESRLYKSFKILKINMILFQISFIL